MIKNNDNVFAKLWIKYLPFIKFCLVGVTNVVISYTAYFILLKLGLYYLLASTIAYIVGILNGYIYGALNLYLKKINQ